MMKVLLCLLVLFLGNVLGRHRKYDEIERMGKYELIEINYDMEHDAQIISFTAFNNDYKLVLTRNNDLIANNIKHTNGIPSDASDNTFVTMTQSCHYRINRELNNGFGGSLSICNKRGLRGKIHGYNETIIIGPSKYYLDLTYDGYYDEFDKHLVYRWSEFNKTDMKVGESKYIGMKNKNNKLLLANNPKKNKLVKNHGSSFNRKLLQINGGIQKTELLIIADPSYYGTFSSYDDMIVSLADNINAVSDEYESTDWGSDIGTIIVGFKEITLIESYNGDFAGLSPTYTSSGVVDSYDYLTKLKDYIGTYRDTSQFDHAMLWTGNDMDSGGIAWLHGICRGSTSTSVVGNGASEVKTAMHELGHSFGSDHDQSNDNNCDTDSGIMGYGYNDWSFSDCTISYVQTFFTDNSNYWKCTDDCSCLSDDIEYISGYEGSGDTCDTSALCVTISGLGSVTYNSISYNLDGTWSYQGCFKNYPYYTMSINGETWYLYYSDYVNYPQDAYHIFFELSVTNALARCTLSTNGVNPTDCQSWYQVAWRWAAWNGKTVSTSSSSSCDYNNEIFSPTSQPSMPVVSPTVVPTSPTLAPTSPSLACDGAYNCLQLSNFDAPYYDFNTEWLPTDCFNDKPYYTATIDGYTWYLYNGGSYWAIYWQLVAGYAYAYGFCSDVVDCNGNWYNYDGSGYASDSDAYISTTGCSSSGTRRRRQRRLSNYDNSGFIIYNNCTNEYGNTVCIESNNGSIWNLDNNNNDGIANFEYNGCINGEKAFWHFQYSDGNYTISYYLHHIENITDAGWYISEESVETDGGIAYCTQSDLRECSYGNWLVKNVYEEDIVEYKLDMSLSYSTDCVTYAMTINNSSENESGAMMINIGYVAMVAVLLFNLNLYLIYGN